MSGIGTQDTEELSEYNITKSSLMESLIQNFFWLKNENKRFLFNRIWICSHSRDTVPAHFYEWNGPVIAENAPYLNANWAISARHEPISIEIGSF